MADYPDRIRLRGNRFTHATRLVPGNVPWGATRIVAVDYDQTACGVTVTIPEADNGCIYLDPSQPVTCPNCLTAT